MGLLINLVFHLQLAGKNILLRHRYKSCSAAGPGKWHVLWVPLVCPPDTGDGNTTPVILGFFILHYKPQSIGIRQKWGVSGECMRRQLVLSREGISLDGERGWQEDHVNYGHCLCLAHVGKYPGVKWWGKHGNGTCCFPESLEDIAFT